jgi:hypothetical protein
MAVRSAARPGRPLPPRKVPGTHFCYRLSRSQGHSVAGRIRSIEKSSDIGIRTRDLPACSLVPQPTTLPLAPHPHRREILICAIATRRLMKIACFSNVCRDSEFRNPSLHLACDGHVLDLLIRLYFESRSSDTLYRKP